MISWILITSGRGPEECRWVVSQLTRYLMADAEKHNLKVELLEAVFGNFKDTMYSALIAVEGKAGLADFIAGRQGSVQWIGRSMFRPKHKRKNWFVSVSTLDQVSRSKWKEREVRIDRMRASGPGGQHVNKTETAIRVTHMPTGLSAIAREERSQHLNKVLAMARLQDLLLQKEQEAEMNFQRKRWSCHNQVERGNATLTFTGRNFKLVNK